MAKAGQPSRKVFIRDLQRCKRCDSQTGDSKTWTATLFGKTTALRFVWLQGTIAKCDTDDVFNLDDGTGTALVGGCSKIPPVCPKPRKGGYFMVIGELKCDGDIPMVKAIKLQDLSDSTAMKTMWLLEVLDQQLSNP